MPDKHLAGHPQWASYLRALALSQRVERVGIASLACYEWPQRYEGMSVDDAKDFRTEKTILKHLDAETAFDHLMQREIASVKHIVPK